jgi:hypothetical protein
MFSGLLPFGMRRRAVRRTCCVDSQRQVRPNHLCLCTSPHRGDVHNTAFLTFVYMKASEAAMNIFSVLHRFREERTLDR